MATDIALPPENRSAVGQLRPRSGEVSPYWYEGGQDGGPFDLASLVRIANEWRWLILGAVALAGGSSPEANNHRVAIFRTIQGKRQAAAFDLASIRKGLAEDPPIFPGDIVVVDGSANKALQKQIMSNLPILSIFRPF